MMKNQPFEMKKLAMLVLALGALMVAQARPLRTLPVRGGAVWSGKTQATCAPATSRIDLDVNNVRATLLNGGDMWWDLVGTALYEIPKVLNPSDPRKHALFSGAVWIGGIDAGGQLKVAAQTYRQNGNDYWPGPLSTVDASTDDVRCKKWDRHFKVIRSEITNQQQQYSQPGGPSSSYAVPTSLLEWPGNGTAPEAPNLAPYVDVDNDGVYDATKGDYPDVPGDMAIWWVYNDKGNAHTETGSDAIGIEIQTTAFAFATSDELNNMTFYGNTIINRSSNSLNKTYMGQWVDADLGYAFDDYVGCDVNRGLGYCYNGDAYDDLPEGYGYNPPSVGVDFFEGPYSDKNDGIDNDRDGQIDELDTINGIEYTERIIMSKFVYYENDFSVRGNPENINHYYNYLIGKWKDGTPITYGGNGYGGGTTCNFMYPDTTDDANANVKWTEQVAGNPPGDRRFLQSAGPFTLAPGAVNRITVGVVWARSYQGDPFASVRLVQAADDKAQKLFEANFQLAQGPPQPVVQAIELDRQTVITINNGAFIEKYRERDPLIPVPTVDSEKVGYDSTYKFEGYIVYQLSDQTVASQDFYDPDKARVQYVVDLKNGIQTLVNNTPDPVLGNVPKQMVAGSDNGIRRTFSITKDLFSLSSDDRLINYHRYFFAVVPYAYNRYKTFDFATFTGQANPFLSTRQPAIVEVIPHKRQVQAGGTELNAGYGSGPAITSLTGIGNGGNELQLTDESTAEILANGKANPTYQPGFGPFKVSVYDPTKVPAHRFEMTVYSDSLRNVGPYFPAGSAFPLNTLIRRVSDFSTWTLKDLDDPSIVIRSDQPLGPGNEQLIRSATNASKTFDYGFSVTVKQAIEPGRFQRLSNNGFLSGTIEFGNPVQPWLYFLTDVDKQATDWIAAGTEDSNYAAPGTNPSIQPIDASGRRFYDSLKSGFLDSTEVYEKVLGGTWSPYRLARATTTGPGYFAGVGSTGANKYAMSYLERLPSVDIVFTADKSKWTRSAVLESGANPLLTAGRAKRLDARKAQGIDQNGNFSTNPVDSGLGWFPGYAIRPETGERLNIMYCEDSGDPKNNGSDMKWNPTANFRQDGTGLSVGGRHFVMIMNTPYSEDSAVSYRNRLTPYKYASGNPRKIAKETALSEIAWTSIPVLTGQGAFLSSDITVKLRVQDQLAVRNLYTPIDSSQRLDSAKWTFDMGSLAAKKGVASIETEQRQAYAAVVPNPYYSYAGYERSQIDNRVKIINLPDRCTIEIYTPNGQLVRRIEKDDATKADAEWNLTNRAGVPISSGMYLVRIKTPDNGEQTVKFFAIMRPVDLDAF